MTGWIYTADGRCIEKGSPEHAEYLGGQPSGPLVFADEGTFISPIDGKAYSGKAGMLEHNRRHDVINNRDLVGLKVGFSPPKEPTQADRRAIRQTIIDVAQRKGYFHGQ